MRCTYKKNQSISQCKNPSISKTYFWAYISTFIITTFEFFPQHIFQYVSAKNMPVCPLLKENPKQEELRIQRGNNPLLRSFSVLLLFWQWNLLLNRLQESARFLEDFDNVEIRSKWVVVLSNQSRSRKRCRDLLVCIVNTSIKIQFQL